MRQFHPIPILFPRDVLKWVHQFEILRVGVKHAAASNYPMYVISAIVYSVIITHFEGDIFLTPPWQKLLMCWNKWLSGNPTWCTHQTGGVSFMARVCPGNKGVKFFCYGCGTSCSAPSGNPRFLITFLCQIIFLHYQLPVSILFPPLFLLFLCGPPGYSQTEPHLTKLDLVLPKKNT